MLLFFPFLKKQFLVTFECYVLLFQVEKNYNECSSSLNWHKERLRELETKITSLQEVCMS